MKDKLENITPDFRVVSPMPNSSSYASSASSTSSYASSLSSASSAAESIKSNHSSSSFLHSKANPIMMDTDRHSQYSGSNQPQYHTLRRYPSGSHSPTTPQLTTPSQSSPSSSPASSTFEGYAASVAIPSKFATLSVNPSRAALHYPNASNIPPPVVSNFRHSVILSDSSSNPVANTSEYGSSLHGNNSSSSANFSRLDISGSRNIMNGGVDSAVPSVCPGMRGISSLGEVQRPPSGSQRSAHYASTPHLFVFQTEDDDSGGEDEEAGSGGMDNQGAIVGDQQITKCNTLSNSRNLLSSQDPQRPQMVPAPNSNASRTLPRLTSSSSMSSTTSGSPAQRTSEEPIYTSTSEIKAKPSHDRPEGIATRFISERYEAPRTLSAARRSSSCSMIAQDSFAVTNQVVARIETSFRGHKTQIWVCRTMANLYVDEGSGKDPDWKLKFTGVPALLLDLGETKSRNKRQLQIILAEKESGFELWKDVIDNLTSYKVQEPHFHTLYLSSDHRRKIGLSFNEGEPAMVFHNQLESLTSNPENISLSAPGKKKSKPKDKPIKYKAPRKTDISTPCNFHHVTAVDPTDRSRLYSLQVYGKSTQSPSAALSPEPHTVVNRPIPPPAAAATAV